MSRIGRASSPNGYTNAEFAHAIAHIERTTSVALVSLTGGMWNPDYAATPAAEFAHSVIDDIEYQIKIIKRRLK